MPPVAPAASVTSPRPRDPPPELAVNRWATAGFVVVGALVWVGSDRLWQDTLAPKSCRIFCEDRVNAFDRVVGDALTWSDDRLPQTLSDVSGYVAVPLVAFGGLTLAGLLEHRRENWWDDMLLIAEATVATGLVNRATALTFGRTRPRTRKAPPDDPIRLDRQAHESFFSGHTSAAFSIGISAAMVASLRRYRIAPWLWGGAIVFGTATGYLRLAGADHYPTDVIAGALVATGIGVGLPLLHRRYRHGTRLNVAPLHDGASLTLSGQW